MPFTKQMPSISPDVGFVATNSIIIGNVTIEPEVSIWYQCTLRSETESIHIQEQSNIQDGCILHTDPGQPICIGKRVTVGHRALLHGCNIGNGSLIGMGAIILNGAIIGEKCLIGAGALVTEGMVIPDGCLAYGNPAKVIRLLNEEELNTLDESASDYLKKSAFYQQP